MSDWLVVIMLGLGGLRSTGMTLGEQYAGTASGLENWTSLAGVLDISTEDGRSFTTKWCFHLF